MTREAAAFADAVRRAMNLEAQHDLPGAFAAYETALALRPGAPLADGVADPLARPGGGRARPVAAPGCGAGLLLGHRGHRGAPQDLLDDPLRRTTVELGLCGG